MQATQSRVESVGWSAKLGWLSHNAVWLGAIGLSFFLGMGVNNGEANKVAVQSVADQYKGKIEYHVAHEKAVASVAKKAIVACEHNAGTALSNAAGVDEIKGCPPPAALAK